MGYDEPDVYNQPEKFDLTFVGEIEWDYESYQFNLTGVWIDPDKNIYYGNDSGCSCPVPWDDFTSVDDLTKVTVWELADYLSGRVDDACDPERYSPRDRNKLTGEVGELILRVRSLTK